jgi:Uma2 family endonuclease
MSAAASQARYIPEDLLTMPDDVQYELVDGRLVERNPSPLASWVGMNLGRRIGNCNVELDLGYVFGPNCSYQCFPDEPGKVRKPKISFIRKGRLPVEQFVRGHIRIAADLAVEVVAPDDLYSDVEQRVSDFLSAGAHLVWIVNPLARKILVHRRDGTTSGLTEHDKLSGEDVLPGFRCRVVELFPAREISAATRPNPRQSGTH